MSRKADKRWHSHWPKLRKRLRDNVSCGGIVGENAKRPRENTPRKPPIVTDADIYSVCAVCEGEATVETRVAHRVIYTCSECPA